MASHAENRRAWGRRSTVLSAFLLLAGGQIDRRAIANRDAVRIKRKIVPIRSALTANPAELNSTAWEDQIGLRRIRPLHTSYRSETSGRRST